MAFLLDKHLRLVAWTMCAVVVGCSGGDVKPAEQAKTGDSAMADMPGMPGMPMPRDDSARGEAQTAAGASKAEVTFTAAQVQHGGVRWEPVAVGTASAAATLPGQLVPNEDRTARLGATGTGRVVAVRVRPGDRVSRGQVLVTLVSPEAGMAQSDVAKAQAEVSSRRAQAAYAKSARERAERLLTLKAIPRQDYERAVADDELARAALLQADAELRRARSTAEQLGAGASASGEIAIRSPLAGVVLSRSAMPGTVVEAGAPLAIVTDPTSLWLSIDAPEKLAALFRVGRPLRFTVPAYPGDTLWARTDAVGAGLDPGTRTLPVRGVVANGDGRLKPEMLANVLVEGGQTLAAVLVPEDAVQLLDGKPVVFVAHPDGKGGAHFVARAVEVASRAGGRVIVTRGLTPGDVVVTRGAFAVKAQIKKGSMPEMEM
jgi:membrane fusion protein, heavy metal efflux system